MNKEKTVVRKEFETIVKILDRVDAMGIGYGDRMSMLMDFSNTEGR